LPAIFCPEAQIKTAGMMPALRLHACRSSDNQYFCGQPENKPEHAQDLAPDRVSELTAENPAKSGARLELTRSEP
jgi:hypothetical protein